MRSYVLVAMIALASCAKNKPPEAPVSPSTTTPTTPTSTVPDPAVPPPATTPTTPTTPAATPDDAAGSLDRAANLLAKGDAASALRAEELLREASKASPDDALVYVNLGVARYQQGDTAGAKSNWLTASQKDPTVGASWLYLGALQEKSGDLTGAIYTYHTGISAAPEYVELRAALVAALRAAGKPDEAIGEAKAALKVNSNSLDVYNNLGLVYMDRNELDLAKFVYLKAMQANDAAESNALIRCNLGRIFFLRGEKSPALFHLQAAIKLDPKLVPALIYLSEIYLSDHNYGDMVPLLETARKEEPRNHGVLMNLGIAYRGVGRIEDAKTAYLQALEVDPRNPDPYFNLGVLYGDYMKLYDESIKAFNQYLTGGGALKDQAKVYIDAVEKEKKRAEKKKAKEEEARQKELQRQQQQAPPPTPAPAPAPAPAPEPTPPTPAPGSP